MSSGTEMYGGGFNKVHEKIRVIEGTRTQSILFDDPQIENYTVGYKLYQFYLKNETL